MKFGEKLRIARLSAGFTQDELAVKCGMKKQNISRYETSDREPNIRTAKRMADVLGISLEDLVQDSDKMDISEDLSPTESSLVSAWRRADDKARRKVAIDLEDFGFEYEQWPELSMAARGGKTAPLDGRPDADEIEAAIKATPSESE